MKGLIVLLSLLFTVSNASAKLQYDASELTDEALIAEVASIDEELNANNHSQEILNMIYNRARVVRRLLNFFASKVHGLEEATDGDIQGLLEEIVVSLEQKNHHVLLLQRVKLHLDKSLEKLEENREVPTEIAILTTNIPDPYNYGYLFINLTGYINFNITNEGNGPASIIGESGLEAPFGTTTEWEFIDYPVCGEVLASGETCTLTVTFSPTVVGYYEDQLVLDYFDGVNNQTLTRDLSAFGN